MSKRSLKKRYRDIEMEVLNRLRESILQSKYMSLHTGEKAIQINIDRYKELSIVNDQLVFFDNNGHHYSIFANCSIEELIEFLEP